MWVSALLAVATIGMAVWGFTLRSDLNSTREDLAATSQELAGTRQELATTKQELDASRQQVEQLESEGTTDRRRRVAGALGAAGGLAAVKGVYDDLDEQLGATKEELGSTEEELDSTEEELEAAQEDLEAATRAADAAAADAEAAEREAAEADTTSDRAQAETAQAKAEAEAATTRSTVVTDCVRAYVTAFGGLFEGDSVREQAAAVRERFEDITDDCEGALAGG